MTRFALILLPLVLGGCTTEYFIRKFMDGPKFCPSDEMNKVLQNRRGINNISMRLKREYVLNNMAYSPDKTEHMRTHDGLMYVADYYQTKASYICGGEGLWGKHDPVFYLGDVVIGKGESYYREELEHKIIDVDVISR